MVESADVIVIQTIHECIQGKVTRVGRIDSNHRYVLSTRPMSVAHRGATGKWVSISTDRLDPIRNESLNSAARRRGRLDISSLLSKTFAVIAFLQRLQGPRAPGGENLS